MRVVAPSKSPLAIQDFAVRVLTWNSSANCFSVRTGGNRLRQGSSPNAAAISSGVSCSGLGMASSRRWRAGAGHDGVGTGGCLDAIYEMLTGRRPVGVASLEGWEARARVGAARARQREAEARLRQADAERQAAEATGEAAAAERERQRVERLRIEAERVRAKARANGAKQRARIDGQRLRAEGERERARFADARRLRRQKEHQEQQQARAAMRSPPQSPEEIDRQRRARRLRDWCIIALSAYAFLWLTEWRPILWPLWLVAAAIFGFVLHRDE